MSCHDLHLRRFGILTMLALLVLASPVSAATIFVAKLNFDTQEGDLHAAFEQFGTVSSVKVITDQQTGRSKGFGFVEMPNAEEAQAAIRNLNTSELDGRTIIVKLAGPGEASGSSRPAGGGGGYGGGSGPGGYGGSRESGGYGGGGKPASQAPTPAAKPAAPPLAPPAATPPTPPTPAPDPVIAPMQPTPQVAVADDAGDERPDADTEPLEGTADLADESETSVGDDEDDVMEEEEEAEEVAEDDGAMADQESGDDATGDAAEVSEDDSRQSPAADEATDIEAGDDVGDDQFEDNSESDEPGDTTESTDEDSIDAVDGNGLASR